MIATVLTNGQIVFFTIVTISFILGVSVATKQAIIDNFKSRGKKHMLVPYPEDEMMLTEPVEEVKYNKHGLEYRVLSRGRYRGNQYFELSFIEPDVGIITLMRMSKQMNIHNNLYIPSHGQRTFREGKELYDIVHSFKTIDQVRQHNLSVLKQYEEALAQCDAELEEKQKILDQYKV